MVRFGGVGVCSSGGLCLGVLEVLWVCVCVFVSCCVVCELVCEWYYGSVSGCVSGSVGL